MWIWITIAVVVVILALIIWLGRGATAQKVPETEASTGHFCHDKVGVVNRERQT